METIGYRLTLLLVMGFLFGVMERIKIMADAGLDLRLLLRHVLAL